VNRSLLVPGLFLAALTALLTLTPACDKQGQGERCDQLNGNDDCADGLVCTPGSQVGQKKDVCCPATGSIDPRCTPGGGQNGGGGAGGTGGSTGGGGSTTGSTTTTTTGGTGGTTGGTGGATGGTGGTGGMK
jgi:hypothetical protein